MHEGELGGPFYRQPEAVAVNGDLRRVITAVPGMCSGIRGLGFVVEVHRFHLGANQAWIRVLWASSTEWGGAGPSAAGSTFRACRATATVPRACAGTAGTRGEPRGLGRRRVAWREGSGPCWPPREVQPPQKLPTPARLIATDARNQPSVRAGCWPGRRGCVQRARGHW